MAKIEDFEEYQLKQHLVSGGFYQPFTDIFGNDQPAPVSQVNLFNSADVRVEGKRFIFIKPVGPALNPTTQLYSNERNMLISVVGLPNISDDTIVKGYATDINNYLIKNPSDGKCIYNIIQSRLNGPFLDSDSRVIYEINLTVMFQV